MGQGRGAAGSTHGARADSVIDHQLPRFRNRKPASGYFFRVDDSGKPRPLLIFNNGSDGSLPFAWAVAIAPALERGYNCLTLYGPGQGLALVDQGLYFRPDWETSSRRSWTTHSRPEVDPSRIALMGDSQGGYWVPRALAFEHRVAAGIADPGVWDVSTSWGLDKFPPPLLRLFNAGNKAAFDRAVQEGLQPTRRWQPHSRFAADRSASTRCSIRTPPCSSTHSPTSSPTNRCPMLVADPEGEQFWPGQSQQLYQALPGAKTLVSFTRAEGADLHCEPKAPGLRAQRMFDWLDDTLA